MRPPLLGRLVAEPEAAKVPEIIVLFWVIKILTTAGGEATSDYLKSWGNIRGGGTELLLFVVGLLLQFGTRRYRAPAYWFLAYAIAILGTGVVGCCLPRCPDPLCRHDGPVGGDHRSDPPCPAPQRGNAFHPQHHGPTA